MSLAGSERPPASTYRGVHDELVKVRGRAVGLPCAGPGCDRPASGWMLWGRPTHIGRNSHGKRVRWSIHLEDYEPGCARCNARADHGGSLTVCKRGHVRREWGATRKGECKGCARERSRARYWAERGA